MALSLALIILLGLGADYLFRRLGLPGLVGMLFAGVLAGPYVLGLLSPSMMEVSDDFRKIALIVILLRAGFELQRDTLNRVGHAALILSIVPAVFEILAVVLVAPRLLQIDYLEAAILGSILAAVSPAVVVPLMIDFMDQGRRTRKGDDWKARRNAAPLIPAIALRFWRDEPHLEPGTGKTMSHRYSPGDPSFHDHWEILYDG